ncbi:pentapeptide repeat-containing protein [Rhodobacteraceae bacterium CCMM004]|nr:pentapeptide repeat-containing protein [Rhodobacteraceae bacterium CCMM004]
MPAEDARNLALAAAVLLGALAAAATLAFRLVGVWMTERSTHATEQGLVTDRINAAVANLGADKTVKTDGVEETRPNLEVRVGAIYALERIARENLDYHIQVMEILCAYIRQNAPAPTEEDNPHHVFWGLVNPDDDSPPMTETEAWEDKRFQKVRTYGSDPSDMMVENMRDLWARKLPPPRLDIQTALTVLGRRSPAQVAYERAAEVPGSEIGFTLDLRGTDLRRADLRAASLGAARLERTHLEGAILGGAHLEGADLRGARLEGADLGGAHLEGADLRGARLEGADLGWARLEGAILGGAHLEGADLRGARLEGADLRGAHLEGADLRGARLEGANLGWARLEGANLGWARLEGADLRGARLEGADLRGPHLEGANLWGARLEGADLRGAHLDASTVFKPATLRGAGLKTVDLTHTTSVVFCEAFGDDSVRLPEGLKAGEGDLAHWATDDLDVRRFLEEWRAHQRRIGYIPREDRS